MEDLNLLDKRIIEVLKKQNITKLLPVQKQALQEGMLDDKHLVVLSPTSSGKTLLGELVAVHKALSRQKTAILVPFKALAEERYADIQKRWEEFGLRVALSTGDYPALETDLLETGDIDIVLFTNERFLSLVTNKKFALNLFSTVVIDEMQLISDKERGPKLEWIMTFIRRLSNPPQIVCLSAVASNLNGIDIWLGAKPIIEDSRPVPLTELVALPDGSCKGIHRKGKSIESLQINSAKFQQGKPELRLLSFLKNQFTELPSQQILVFRCKVADTEETALNLSAILTMFNPAVNTINALKEIESTEISTILISCLQHSVAFHNSELTLEERRIIEKGFRDGEIKCLIATATLAMGVNLPCNKVIITELERPWIENKEERLYKVAEYRNMSGRAGRFGLTNEDGFSFYLANDEVEADYIRLHFIEGNLEPIDSALKEERLDILVLYCLSYLGKEVPITTILEVILDTFAGSQRWSPIFKQEALGIAVNKMMDLFCKHGLVEENSTGFTITPLGNLCINSGMDIKSFIEAVTWIKEKQDCNKIEFLAMLCSLASVYEVRFPQNKSIINNSASYVHRLLSQEIDRSKPSLIELLTNLTKSYKDWGLVLRARMLAALIAYGQGTGIGEIERGIRVRSGTLSGLIDKAVWVMDTCVSIAEIFEKGLFAEQINKLLESIKFGVPEKGRDLARLEVFSRNQILNLIDSNIVDPVNFLNSTEKTIGDTLFKGKLHRVKEFKEKVIFSLGPVLPTYQSQVETANEDLVTLIHNIYCSRGQTLEKPVFNLIRKYAPELNIKRIKNQKSGEADFTFETSEGKVGIIQLASRGDSNKKIGINKAGQVLQQSPELRPEIFICIAFPDLDNPAKLKAVAHGENVNYKAISVPDLIEIALKIDSGKLSPTILSKILVNDKGVIQLSNYVV